MLKAIKVKKSKQRGGHFAIIASKYNARYVDAMLREARKTLEDAGAETVEVVRVPGAFEIPVIAARLARAYTPPLGAIICLGVILRGETMHAQLIAEAVSSGLVQVQLNYEVPIIHEILLLENKQQAEVRCLSAEHNRGAEAAQTALEMAQIMTRLLPAEARSE